MGQCHHFSGLRSQTLSFSLFRLFQAIHGPFGHLTVFPIQSARWTSVWGQRCQYPKFSNSTLLHPLLLPDQHCLSQIVRILLESSVRNYVHRALANHLGISLPCLRSTLFGATFGNVVFASSYFVNFLNTSKSGLGFCHFHHVLCTTCEVLGTRLQYETGGSF